MTYRGSYLSPAKKALFNSLSVISFTIGIGSLLLMAHGVDKAEAMVVPQVSIIRSYEGSNPRPAVQEVHDFISEVFGVDGEKAWKIVSTCENSKLNPEAINHNRNGSTDIGIFQINSIHGYRDEDLKDWKFNVRAAYAIYKKAGKSFSPWACSHVIGVTPFYKK